MEHASFTPVVTSESAIGGLTHEAIYFYKCLASSACCLISRGNEYSVVMGWLQCSLSFSLFSLVCVFMLLIASR